MTLLASIFALCFVGCIVCGLLVHMYLYSRGAFTGGKIKSIRKNRLSAASFSQTATMPIPDSAADLYYGGIGAPDNRTNSYQRRLLLYSLAIVVTVALLGVLVVGATQF